MASSRKSIRVEETAEVGVVVAGLEVIELGFGVVDVAAVAQGVMGTQGGVHRAGGGQNVAPCIVAVGYHLLACAVQDPNHIALQVGGVVVICAVIAKAHGGACGIVGKGQNIRSHHHLPQLGAAIDVAVGNRAVAPADTHTVSIVGIGPGGAVHREGGKLSAVAPGVAPGAVGQGVADLVVGNGDAVILRQQVAPVSIVVTVGNCFGGTSQFAGVTREPSPCHRGADVSTRRTVPCATQNRPLC